MKPSKRLGFSRQGPAFGLDCPSPLPDWLDPLGVRPVQPILDDWNDIGEGQHQSLQAGTVRWFNSEKGYGFIAPDDGSDDLFAHFSEIDARGLRSLEEGQKVEYEAGQGQKGPQAQKIRPV